MKSLGLKWILVLMMLPLCAAWAISPWRHFVVVNARCDATIIDGRVILQFIYGDNYKRIMFAGDCYVLDSSDVAWGFESFGGHVHNWWELGPEDAGLTMPSLSIRSPNDLRFCCMSGPGIFVTEGDPTEILIELPFWIPVVCLAIPAGCMFWRDLRRRAPNSCAACHYNLTGNQSGICPECGKPIEIPASTVK